LLFYQTTSTLPWIAALQLKPERDDLIAAAPRAYFAWPRPGEDASDLAVINAHAVELNAEAEDALAYQVPL
jgi:hypothetical protein